MVSTVPILTNENFHMFEPSQLETSLANKVGGTSYMNPQAFPLMMDARIRGEAANSAYQSQVDQMHRAQIAEAMMAQQTARGAMIAGAMRDAGQTPGMVQALQSGGGGGLIPGLDLSGIAAGANAKANATNIGVAGRGLGEMSIGGFTGLQPAAQSVVGPSVGQGDPALVRAAGINANGRIAASGNNPGMVNVTVPQGPVGPNQPTVHFKAPIGAVPGLPFVGGGGNPLAGGDPNAAPYGSNIIGNPLLGGIPGLDPQLADKGVAARPAGSFPAQPTVTKTPQQIQQSVAAALPNIAAYNPIIHADIIAGAVNGAPNIIPNPHGPGYIIQGAKGQYNAQGF